MSLNCQLKDKYLPLLLNLMKVQRGVRNLEPIRVLHVFGGLDAGGAESRTMDIYRQINKEKVQFDFLIHTEKRGFFEDEIIKMGGRIYRVPRFGINSIISYPQKTKDFFAYHPEYKIVHGHILSTAFIYQRIARKYKVPVRIAHSRCGSRTEFSFENLIKEFFKRLTKFYVTDQFAVSRIAGESAFGTRNVKNGKVKILPNAIQSDRYLYNEELRNRIRKELNLEDKLVVGHIGRFQQQKNHKFLVEIFNEIQSIQKKSVLLLIGDGELKKDIQNKVEELGLRDKVIFAGVRSDVPDLLQIMDVLLFPSFFEGLPGVVLEAQAAGLPCVISDKITSEVKITDLVEYVSLEKNAEYWADKVILSTDDFIRENIRKKIVEAGYDIKSVAKWYETFYLESENGYKRS